MIIRQRLALCRQALEKTAAKAGVSSSITLVAVTKGVALPLIYEAIDCGVTNIGENRIQETLLKYAALNEYAQTKGYRLKWHMVGHLQTNKVKDAVKIFDLIHSVDSVRLASEINRHAINSGKVQDILLQVNVSGEHTKFGFIPEAVLESAGEIAALKGLRLKGLMTIAPFLRRKEETRPFFRQLKELKDKINRQIPTPLTVLSMGMTNDYKVAIEEGANVVRIGTAIFGERREDDSE